MDKGRTVEQKKKEETSFGRWLLELIIIMVVMFTGVQLLFHYVLAKDIVTGPSMEPTFYDNDRLITYRLDKIKRGSVIVLDAPDDPGSLYIKRVIGLPGDKITAKNDQLYINGKKYNEPYLKKYATDGNFTTDFSLEALYGRHTVPKNSYFVMGDNRPVSKDSRRIGFIKKDDINGVVKLRYWPLNRLKIF